VKADDLDTVAAQWIVRREKAGWSKDDQCEFDAWLAAPGNRIAYLRLSDVWNRAGRLKALAPPGRRGFFFRGETFKAAAKVAVLFALAVIIGAGGYAWFSRSNDVRYATGLGEREIISLADGSRIELNTQTVLRLASVGDKRIAKLETGQAYFDIKHDPAHPFTVLTNGHKVTDIGTKFEIRTEPNKVQVTLFEGSAEFESDDPSVTRQNAILVPGDVAVATAKSMRITRKPRDKLVAELGWRNGVIVFDHTTLADAAAEFNRYNRKKLIVTDPKVAKLTIGGTFQTTNTSQLTQLARDIFGLTIEDRGADIVISR
jgi:transmembrane sensor